MDPAIAGRMALLRLHRLHSEIVNAHKGQRRWLGIILAILLAIMVLAIMGAIGASLKLPEAPWALTSLVVTVGISVGSVVLHRREVERKAAARAAALSQQLDLAIDEISTKLPAWVVSMGGRETLSDGQRFNDLVEALRSKPGPALSSPGMPEPALFAAAPSAGSAVDPGLASGAANLRKVARGFLAGAILNTIVGIMLLFLVPPVCLLTFTLATLEYVYAAKFWKTPPAATNAPRWLAILEICGALIGSLWAIFIGIANLRRLNAPETKLYLASLRNPLG